MSTDPREFEHPIDGTTPNELPTVLGVGSLAPEAIEAAARVLSGCRAEQWESAAPHVKDSNRWAAQVALTAALPFIAAQAKGEALREAADACAPDYETTDTRSVAKWLRARAATIESEATNV